MELTTTHDKVIKYVVAAHTSCTMKYMNARDIIFTTWVTSGAGTVNPSGAPEFFPGYLWVRVANSLVLDVVFCRSLFVLSAGHCFVSPSI